MALYSPVCGTWSTRRRRKNPDENQPGPAALVSGKSEATKYTSSSVILHPSCIAPTWDFLLTSSRTRPRLWTGSPVPGGFLARWFAGTSSLCFGRMYSLPLSSRGPGQEGRNPTGILPSFRANYEERFSRSFTCDVCRNSPQSDLSSSFWRRIHR